MRASMTHHPAARAARLAEIRRQVEAGTYESPDKVAGAVDVFLERIARRPLFADPPAPRNSFRFSLAPP